MSNEIVLIVVLMVVGGGIAYLGDWIGFTMGKRRLSVLGLRPRHTARVFTVASGAVIVVLTFLILLWVDAGFRIAVREGANIIHRNHVLGVQNRALQTETTAALAAQDKAYSDQLAAESARNIAESQLQADNQRIAVDRTAITVTGTQLAAVRTRLGVKSAELSDTNAQLTQAEAQSERLQRQISDDIAIVNNRLLPEMKEKVLAAPIYGSQQEIGRTVIVSDQRVEEIKQELRAFLLHLSVEAQQRGAVRGANGRFVEVASVKISGQQSGPETTFANEEQSVNALASEISADRSTSSVVVIARAWGNAFTGEQVVIILRPFFNRLALPKGTVLAQITVPASDTQSEKILDDLKELLQRARESAISAGVIPITNPQANESEVGQTNIADLFTAVEQIKKVGGAAVVTASAAQDTYSANQLSLNFVVTPATSESSSSSGT